MNQAQAVTALGTLLQDTLNQVSSDRLTAAVAEAWRDQWVATPVFDTSLSFQQGVFQYALPSDITRVDSIQTIIAQGQLPQTISADLWEVVNGILQFNNKANYLVPTNYALYLRGQYKLQATDTIPSTNQALINYVNVLAGWIVLKDVAFTKTLSFLHNDTTLSEVIGFRNTLAQDVQLYRSQLQTQYSDN